MTAPEAGDGRTYRNPVHAHDAPDPTVIRAPDGTFHCFTTQSLYDGELLNLPHLVSRDLVTWELLRDAMPQLPAWAAHSIWAPHVDRSGDSYLIYYCAKVRDSEAHAIGVMSAPALTGDFVDRGSPLVTRADEDTCTYAAIDPFSLVTQDGRRILYWGSGYAPIRARELTPDGLELTGPTHVVLEPFESEGGYCDLVEAAEVRYSSADGYYYLWVSGDDTHIPHYAISEFRSREPDRGFQENANPANPVLSDGTRFVGPGHHSIVADDAGQWWVLYHAKTREDVERLDRGESDGLTSAGVPGAPRMLLLDRVDAMPDGWSAVNDGTGPSAEPRPVPVIRPAG